MNNKQLTGTAFEYAYISMHSAKIANDIQQLLSYLGMYENETKNIKLLLDAKELLTKYHFDHTFSSFDKKFNIEN